MDPPARRPRRAAIWLERGVRGARAGIIARFIQDFKPHRQACWVADKDGTIIGSVFVVEEESGTAKLRMLYVEPDARGEGLGTRLIDEAVKFVRVAGYARLILWTNGNHTAAGRLYEKAGFKPISEEPHESFGQFGHKLTGQYWEFEL